MMKATANSQARFLGPILAITSAVLYALSAPAAKVLVQQTDPLILAGLFYFGSGLGLSTILLFQSLLKKPNCEATGSQARSRADLSRLLGATLFGGIIAPILIMLSYKLQPASVVSLLLNFEIAFTAMIAWFVFKENFDRRLIFGLLCLIAGGILVTWKPGEVFVMHWSSLLAVAGCLFWAVDNNLTTQIALVNPLKIVRFKGLVSGVFNLTLAIVLKHQLPPFQHIIAALLVGFICFGLSLTLFIRAMRLLGAARSSAYFATEPFVGSLLCVLLLHETLSPYLIGAASAMAVGVWIFLTESHDHDHVHTALEHAHPHVHDEHHQHLHDHPVEESLEHTHLHRHENLKHSHPHTPDLHHSHHD
jgi:drug/metabolite transporter (DMT)-like permease